MCISKLIAGCRPNTQTVLQKTGAMEHKKQKQKQNGVDGASGRLTLFNRAVNQVLTGIELLERTQPTYIFVFFFTCDISFRRYPYACL